MNTTTTRRPVTWPEPTDTVMELAANKRMGAAIRAYRDEAWTTLWDGTRVKPTLPTCRDVITAELNFPGVSVVVSEGDYVTEARLNELAAAHAAKMAAFQEAMPVPFERQDSGTCDVCHAKGVAGWMSYAPDASGHPTPVLFTCDEGDCSSHVPADAKRM